MAMVVGTVQMLSDIYVIIFKAFLNLDSFVFTLNMTRYISMEWIYHLMGKNIIWFILVSWSI